MKFLSIVYHVGDAIESFVLAQTRLQRMEFVIKHTLVIANKLNLCMSIPNEMDYTDNVSILKYRMKIISKQIQEWKEVCVFGDNGATETAHVNTVYNKEDVNEKFACRSLVTVKPMWSLRHLLKTILQQVTSMQGKEKLKDEDLILRLNDFLKGKRKLQRNALEYYNACWFAINKEVEREYSRGHGGGLSRRACEELVKRNMVEITKRRSDESPKKCQPIGSLHDIFLPRALELGIFHLHQESDKYSHAAAKHPFRIRRVVGYTNIKDYSTSKAFNQNLQSYVSFKGENKDMPAEEVRRFLERTIGVKGFGLLKASYEGQDDIQLMRFTDY
nr:putative NB-ARC [Tanacetum cinerariifolium]